MPTDEHRRCETCGGPIPPTAPSGVCKACLATALTTDLGMGETPPRRTDGPADLVVPGYDLGQLLGEGASGEVWLAREREAPRREVALKILKPDLVAGAAGVRFEAEMSALALMDHPGIARVLGSGRTGDGRPYFAMERVEGAPITEICEVQKLGVRARLALFRKLCEAMAHAHRRGIIHRDLKPSNILVAISREGEEASYDPKVIDFGIAKATENLLTERTLLTRANVFLGTPAYMSPEQAAMQSEAIDTRTDIYSLGVVLYELLTGARPFAFAESSDLPYDEILKRIRTEDPPRPSVVVREREGEREAKGRLSPDLDWIVMKALEKNPERRYETADAFARDIANFLEGDAVSARPPTVSYRVRKYVRKNRLPVAAAAAVALAMIAGTAVSLVMYVQAEESATLARKAATRASENAARAETSDARGREIFSHSDFTQASPLLQEQNPALAVAHLVRAVRTNPENRAAASRLLHTLASENWAIPCGSLPIHGQFVFSGDGSRLAVAPNAVPGGKDWHPYFRVFPVEGGSDPVQCDLQGDVTVMTLAPDGKTLAVGTNEGTVSVWDLESGQRRQQLEVDGVDSCSRLAFSPAGDLLALADSHKGTALVWRMGEDTPWQRLRSSIAGYVAGKVAFSPDGTRLAFGGGPALGVYELKTGKLAIGHLEHAGEITGVEFLSAEKLATWSKDTTARVWDLATGKAVLTLTHEREVVCGALSPDGSRLLTGTGGVRGEGGMVRIWDLAEGVVLGKTIRHSGGVSAVSFSRDGLKAVSGSEIQLLGDGAVKVFDGWTGELLATPIYHPRGALSVALSPDGSHVAIGSRHLETALWEIPQGAMQRMRLAHPASVWRAVFEEAGAPPSLLTLTYGGFARRWDAATGELLAGPETAGKVAVAAHAARGEDRLRQGFFARRALDVGQAVAGRFREGGVAAAAASDDGRLLATGCHDGKVRIWSLESGVLVGTPLEHGEAVTAVAFDAEGSRLVSAGQGGDLKLWQVDGGELLETASVHESEVRVAAFSPDGLTVASGATDGTVRLWWPGRNPSLGPVLDHHEQVNHLAFSPDGTVLAGSGMENTVRLWETSSGRALARPMAHIDDATYGNFMLWSPDGRRLVSAGSHDNTARLWDARTGKLVAKPMEQSSAATALALRPDGEVLLYGARTARLWHLPSGEPLTPVLPLDSPVHATALSAAFDARGRRLAIGTALGNVFLWDYPDPGEGMPEWFLDYAEAVGGFRFNSSGVIEQASGPTPDEMRSEVLAKAGSKSGSAHTWMRWLAGDREGRSISPESAVTVERFVDQLAGEENLESLRAAILLRPGDPEIMAELGVQFAARGNSGAGEKRFGRFLVDRAMARAPDSPALRRARVRVLLAEDDREAAGFAEATRVLIATPDDPEAWLLLARAMGGRHWHFGEALAFAQARALAETAGDDVIAERARKAGEALRQRQSAGQGERFDEVVAAADSRARELIRIFEALHGGEPSRAVREAGKVLRERPTEWPDWATLGEVSILVSQLEREAGNGGAATRHLRSACAALACGGVCATRRETLALMLANDGDPLKGEDETPLIERGSGEWAYLDGTAARTPPEDWATPGFDDASWKRGEAPLGYGDGDEATTIDFGSDPEDKVMTTYFRHEFRVEEKAEPKWLQVRIRRDDGAVVYFNGVEVIRSNMPEGPVEPDTPARGTVGGEDEGRFLRGGFPASRLQTGRNVLAVEVHQANPGSSDLTFDLDLVPGMVPLARQLAEIPPAEVKETLELDPVQALWMEGVHAIDRREFVTAEMALRAAREIAPENLEITADLGFVSVRLGKLEEAQLLFERGLALAAKQGKVRQMLERNLQYVRSRIGAP